MALRKAQVDFLVDQFVSILCDTPIATERRFVLKDVYVVKRRVSHEGLSFLTKTLPTLGKALDQALETGRFVPPARTPCRPDSNTPKFLWWCFSLVFDESGVLRTEPNVDAIKHLRQVCFYMYKLQVPYSDLLNDAVIDRFVETDKELEVGGREELFITASHIAENVLSEFNFDELIPRHGPGAVATREVGEEKWVFSRIYSPVERVFPFNTYFRVGGDAELEDRKHEYDALKRVDDPIARVVLVPKDSRGPRLISCEPLEIQWIQQGIAKKLVNHLEANPLTGGQINFSRQSVNQKLALDSSVSRQYATLDLKDASDRVSIDLVKKVFGRLPDFLDKILATRSTATELPDKRVITLNKFAPMGSALCFPVEALVFWVVLVAAVVRRFSLPLSEVSRHIFVYGDDIIVPVIWYDVCCQALADAGLVVNEGKSFRSGFFRESCGVDAYRGVDVTPIRLKSLPSGQRGDGSMLANYEAVANSLKAKGYTRASEHLFQYIESLIGKLPEGTPNSGFLNRNTNDPFSAARRNTRSHKWRWNSDLQRIEVSVYCLLSGAVDSVLDGWCRMLRNFTSGAGDEPSRVVIRRTTKVKRRWRAVY